MDFRYKSSRIKQYLNEGRALLIETVINKPSDIGVLSVCGFPHNRHTCAVNNTIKHVGTCGASTAHHDENERDQQQGRASDEVRTRSASPASRYCAPFSGGIVGKIILHGDKPPSENNKCTTD